MSLNGVALLARPVVEEQVIGMAVAVPTTPPVGVSTVVKVTAVIDDASLIRASVNLQRLDETDRVVATPGVLVDDGTGGDAVAGDKIFTIQTTILETNPTVVRLRVSAAFEGRLTRVFSPVLQVNVTAASADASAPAAPQAVSDAAQSAPPDTVITGTVLDKDNQPISGVTMRLFRMRDDATSSREVVAPAVTTDAQGRFTIPQAPVGTFKLLADGATAPNGPWQSTEFDVTVVAGRTNDVGLPISLPPLNVTPVSLPAQAPAAANRLCVDGATGGTLTLPQAPEFSLTVLPGSATFPGGSPNGCVTVAPANGGKPLTSPGFGPQPRFVVTVQPVGTTFNPPAAVTLPNVDGLPAGAVTKVYSYDHNLSSFSATGTGRVSEDGRVIRSDIPLAAAANAANVQIQAQPQRLNENCIVSVLNRNTRVRADGSWVLPNIPANFGLVRARATCTFSGVTVSGESAPFLIEANGSANVPPIVLGPTTPIPTAMVITAPSTRLTQIGATSQLTVTANYADNTTRNVTAGSTGTTYVISNTAIASITPDGLVQALSSGTALIQATHEGGSGLLSIQVVLAGDSDGDGIPDDVELSLGLDPNNAADALGDLDHDGLSNLDEYRRGTNPRVADTDGDGLSDGDEVRRGTNPLLVDTDGDGVSDGLEVATGSDPLDPANVNLARALDRIEVAPNGFTITVNAVVGVAYTQLRVTGFLHDNRTIDLTSTSRGTNYASSDLNVCNFGAPDGRVFGGSSGPCTITVTNSGFTASVTGAVTNFQPVALSSIAIPGYANNVDVNGNYAYVASGSTGLQVVDVSNPSAPVIVGAVDTPGNANDVRVVGNTVYIADGAAGLQIVDVTNPRAPAILGALDTPGEANDVFVVGTLAYVADGTSGLQIISVANPRAPLLVRTVDTPGTAQGVAVSGGIAVIADDSPAAGLRVVDVSNPSAAQLVGNVALDGQPIDVDLAGTHAYVADYTGGMKVVDVFQPTAPGVIGGLPGTQPDGFVPRDVQVAGQFAIFAEQLFANAVAPIVDITDPTTPRLRGVIDFGQDYAGTGVAVSGPYVYWTGQTSFVGSENGVNGTTRLFIGQYIALEDRAGVPPTVAIDSPANGGQVIEGTSVTVHVTATDDVAISSVTFLVNGQAAFTDTSQPYEYTLTVPTGGNGTLTLGATAIDFGANVGTAANVALAVIPDPLTTVTGRVVDFGGDPVAGATVTVFGQTTLTSATGTFSLVGVPTARGNIVASVTLQRGTEQLAGSSTPTPPVAFGTTNVGTITIIAAAFETDFGTLWTTCDDCFNAYRLPFTFRFYGTNYTTAYVGTNGYITFRSGDSVWVETLDAFANQPRAAAFFDDLYGGRGNGGTYVNTALPGRFVVTYSNVPHYYFGTAAQTNTLQITLFQDGRILFAYRGITATTTGTITGITPGPNSPLNQVHYTQTPSFTAPVGSSVLEYFTSTNPFNLANKAIMFTPLPDGSYSVQLFDLPPP